MNMTRENQQQKMMIITTLLILIMKEIKIKCSRKERNDVVERKLSSKKTQNKA